MVSHNLQQRGAAEARDVKFAVEQRMGSAVMLLQEVRNWSGCQNVLSCYELYTGIDLDTAVAIPRDFAGDVREKVLSKKIHFCCYVRHCLGFCQFFLVTVMSPKVICRRCCPTSRIVIGSGLNVSLAPSLEGLTGSRTHPNVNGASSRWREAVTEWMHSLRLRALCTFDHRLTLPHVEWDHDSSWKLQQGWPLSAGLFACF